MERFSKKVQELMKRHNIVFVPDTDERFPKKLKDVSTPHNGIWVRGDLNALDALNTMPCVGVSGARDCTTQALNITRDLVHGLVPDNVIVSGGAFGIDSAAHHECVREGDVTVAVMAGGLDRLYPSSKIYSFEDVMQSGCLLSIYPPGTEYKRHRFLERNKYIAMLSDGVVIIEARQRSGSMNTARHARELGRPVGAVPGNIYSTLSDGCHVLIRDGATLIRDADDVKAMIGGDQS